MALLRSLPVLLQFRTPSLPIFENREEVVNWRSEEEKRHISHTAATQSTDHHRRWAFLRVHLQRVLLVGSLNLIQSRVKNAAVE